MDFANGDHQTVAIGPELDGAVVVDENDDADQPKDVVKHDRYVHSEYVKAKLARFTPEQIKKAIARANELEKDELEKRCQRKGTSETPGSHVQDRSRYG